MKERRCDNCAWGRAQDGDDVTQDYCHYDREPVRVYAGWWCRHWSETTGWDVFDNVPDPGIRDLQEKLRLQKGLLRLAAELFERDLELYRIRHMIDGIDMTEATDLGVRERWLEEYKTKC